LETQHTILGDEGAVDVVDVLCALTVLQRGMQDHDGTSVYYEADLPPEGTVEMVGEVVEDPREELSGEGMSLTGLRSEAVMGTMTGVGNVQSVVCGIIGRV